MEKFDLSQITIAIITLCVTGVAFKIKITDLTIFNKIKIKSLDLDFKSNFAFRLFKLFKKSKTKTTIFLLKVLEKRVRLNPLKSNNNNM